MKKFKIVLLAILILAAFLRLNQLTTLPALNADEAAIGYNAYSLLQTGKDEHGNPWPVHFQSFNDWKPGLYFYIVMPFVKTLGLTELAVRLPGALLGIATVLVVWLLVRELFPEKRWLAELSALFLAISPWHIHFSRGGWEVNVATFFVSIGIWAFLKFRKSAYWLYISAIAFVASAYTYHAARIIVPLLLVGLLVIYKKEVLKRTKAVLAALVLGIVLISPLTIDLLGPAGISRAAGVGLFADTGPFWKTNEQRGEHADFKSLAATLLHNKPVNYGIAFLENYTEHLGGEFLVLSGDEIQRNKVPEMGQLYLLDLIFLAVAFIAITRQPRGWGVFLVWLFVAPIAAALTFQAPHALRAQNMIVPLTAISSFGAWSLGHWLRSHLASKKIRAICYIILVTFLVWDFTRYLHQYYAHMAKTYDFSSQYGVKELVQYIDENKDKYSRVIMTDRYDQPYILSLFYMKYPPQQFQENHKLTPRDEFGFSTVRDFDKFTFVSIGPWDKIQAEFPKALLAGTDGEIPDAANILKEIYFPSGRIAFQVVAN